MVSRVGKKSEKMILKVQKILPQIKELEAPRVPWAGRLKIIFELKAHPVMARVR